MSAASPIDVVRAYFAAAHQDEAALLATVATDGFIDVPASLPYGGLHRGHDGFRAALAGFAAAWRNVRSMELSYALSGGQVVSLSRMTATAVPTGRPVDMRVAETFRVIGGKIAEVRPYYFDTAALLQALAA